MKGKCYIGICRPANKATIKRLLAETPGVYRVTDHGSHLKVNSRKPLPSIVGFVVELVADQTTHFDAKYWDFAMAAYRHATRKEHEPRRALGVMIHYLNNLFLDGTPEGEYMVDAGLRRIQLDRTVTDEQAHGWELPVVRRLKKRTRRP